MNVLFFMELDNGNDFVTCFCHYSYSDYSNRRVAQKWSWRLCDMLYPRGRGYLLLFHVPFSVLRPLSNMHTQPTCFQMNTFNITALLYAPPKRGQGVSEVVSH